MQNFVSITKLLKVSKEFFFTIFQRCQFNRHLDGKLSQKVKNENFVCSSGQDSLAPIYSSISYAEDIFALQGHERGNIENFWRTPAD